jgi:hypothetical protein
MKQFLFVVLSTVALSASAQTSLQPANPPAEPRAAQSQTVIVRGLDGKQHQFEVPRYGGDSRTFAPDQEMLDLQMLDLENGGYSQRGCPVRIMDASFQRPAELMLVAQRNSLTSPTLRLSYLNYSGKDIESVLFTGYLKVKDNPYRMDYTIHPFALKLSRKSLLGKDVQATEALKLAGDAYGVDRIELSQIIYADGTTWNPARRDCVYPMTGITERAKAW